MISFGSCNLHILHDTFKFGFNATGWEIKRLLKASFQILHDSVAHRVDFISITKSTKFPLAFSTTCWVEDQLAADRLIQIWPDIMKTVKYWILPISKQPQSKSFEIVTDAVSSNHIPLKLSFFIYMTFLFQPFYKEYQCESLLYRSCMMILEKNLKEVVSSNCARKKIRLFWERPHKDWFK